MEWPLAYRIGTANEGEEAKSVGSSGTGISQPGDISGQEPGQKAKSPPTLDP